MAMAGKRRAKSIGRGKVRNVRSLSSGHDERWTAFQNWLNLHADGRWVFRGLGDVSFELVPSAGRVRGSDPSNEL